MVLQRVTKARTHRGKRFLTNKEPKLIENVKQTLFIPGRKTHEMVSNFIKELTLLKKPHAVTMKKKTEILPFEDISPVEQLCQKYDASLFVFTSHNKKRPNNLILGRTFDFHLLDMFEFGVESFRGMPTFDCVKPSLGVKPALVFLGDDFEHVHHLKRLKSLLIDLFHQKECEAVNFSNVEYVVTFLYAEDKIFLRTYKINLKNVGEGAPRVELEAQGPFADLKLRRKVLASNDLFKKACFKPKLEGKKIQNVKRDKFGSKLGRVHMTSQNMKNLETRKMKGLKKTPQERKAQRDRKRDSNYKNSSIPAKKSKIQN